MTTTMMTRLEVSINKALAEGFVLTEEGYGSYLPREEFYRAQGLMVISWYIDSDKEGEKKYRLYTREKKTRGKKVSQPEPTPDYSSMTVKELRQVCKDKGMTGYSRYSKAELIEALNK